MTDSLPIPELPVPDLEDPPSGTWRVYARAFRDPVGDADRVAVALGLALDDARRLVASAPAVICERVRRSEAERIAALLEAFGAKVLVEDERGAHAEPSTQPSIQPSPITQPSPTTQPPPHIAPVVEHGDLARSFWVELPLAFIAPVLGKGALLIAGAGLLGALALFIALFVPMLFVKIAGAILLGTVGLGILVEVFAKLAQAASHREPGTLPVPQLGMPDRATLTMRGFSVVAVLALVGALAYALGKDGSRIGPSALALFFAAYWPLGLAIQGITGRFIGIFDVLAGARVIAAAPVEYAVVVVLSYALLLGLSLVVYVGGMLTLVTTAVLAGANVAIAAGAFVILFLYFAGLTYAHGVLGYAMGALVSSKEERLAFLVEE